MIIPFISLSEDANRYVVLFEAPGLSISNIEIQLKGRVLAISSSTGSLFQAAFEEHRIRLPGPIEATGPPSAEIIAEGRLRVTMRKEDKPLYPSLPASWF